MIVLLVIMALSPIATRAQVELSNSIDMGFPVLLNKYNQNTYYKQISTGLRFGLSYKPNATQFYPTVDFAFGRTRLPLTQFEKNVAFLNCNYLDVMAKGNFVANVFQDNTLFLSLGIGVEKLKQKGPGVSGPSAGSMKIYEDSSTNVTKYFPAIGIGLEYVYGESVGRNIYLSVGVNLRYTILFDEENTYYLSVVDAQSKDLNLKGALVGGIFTPDFHITLHYMPGQEVFFWKKKD